MNLIAFIKKMKSEGKTADEIIDAVADQFPEVGTEDFKKALASIKKSEDLKTELEAEKKTAEASKAVEADEQKLAKSVKEEVSKQVDEALAGIKNPNDAINKAANTVTSEFKSFIGDFVVTNDQSWRPKLLQLVKFNRTQNHEESRKLAAEFLRGSKLYSKEEKDDLGQKLLRGDATTGSYAVPDEFSDMVFAIAQAQSAIFNGATKLPMSSDTMYLLGAGDVTITEVANQNTDLTNSEPVLSQTAMGLIDAGAVSYIHDNLIVDSNVNIVTLLANSFGRGVAKYQKRATTVGNIATTGDLINGIYSTSGIGSVAVADHNGSISYDDLCDLEGAIDDSFLDGAHFEMNRREFTKIRKIKDNQGRPILTTPDAGYRNWALLGYPVKMNNQMPITLNSTTGARTGGATATILFLNPSEVQIGVRGGFQLESSMHYKFISRQTTFRGFVRWAQAVVQATACARLTGIK